ncbi:MAG: class I SAM-dependent methyltransferase [Lachnospiraceae bacterium]|nr:class I SAM-dependent methyltransferase [Candidatus Colinaster equi]
MENEVIGKVKLDYSHYSGQDLYCDGEVEDEILDIVTKYSPVEYGRIIEERKSWPVLYHLSTQRENIVSWLPIDKSMKVLEIGAGCGAITGVLSDMAKEVTCVDLSRKRSLINAHRHEECDNITINVGNFSDIEPDLDTDYDYALLIGVFEYGQSYIGGKTPYEDFLTIIRKHVKPGGSIVIAIENRYGMKYFAGCKEDHLGTYFSSIECYKNGGGVRTFSKNGLKKIFESTGENEYHFYYPYPDYKFMTTLFSDDELPKKGELYNNLRNFDQDRMLLFDEQAAFDGVLEDGHFPFFSNSYLVVLGARPDTDYIRYSSDRASLYSLSTRISKGQNGKIVKKHALSINDGPGSGHNHVNNMVRYGELLADRYSGSKLQIVPCKQEENGTVSFPYVSGRPLSEMFDELLANGDVEGFTSLFDEYFNRIDYGNDEYVSDLDLVFSNILVDGDTWTVIDYEWVEEKKIPTKEIAFRALYCYLLENEERNKFNFELIIEKLGITPDEAEGYRLQEAAFQKKVTGKRLSMGELRNLIGGPILMADKLLTAGGADKLRSTVQIYEDYGRGFNEDDSFFVDEVYNADNYIEFSVPIDSKACKVRIDPFMDYCMTEVHEIALNGEVLDIHDNKRVYVNGKKLQSENGVNCVFYYNDPNIVVEVKDKVRSTGNLLRVRMTTGELPGNMVKSLKNELQKKIRF